jgi:hypothetical protein
MFLQDRHQHTIKTTQAELKSNQFERAEGLLRISLILGFLVVVAVEGLVLIKILIY